MRTEVVKKQVGIDLEGKAYWMDLEVGKEGKGEKYGEGNMETYITICKVDSQWEFAV